MDADERRRCATDKAAQYFIQLEDPDLPRREREEIVDWLRESPVHVAEMLRIAEVNGALEQFKRWAHVAGDRGEPVPSNVIPLGPRAGGRPAPARNRFSWNIAAACVVAVACAGTWLALRPFERTIETERGERRELTLSDGSRLDMDPRTRLRVKFSGTRRDILLDSGRALFKVARDAQRPFVVRSQGTSVRAVGTEFGVEYADNSLVITVAEGKVAVGRADTQHTDQNQGPQPAPISTAPVPPQSGSAQVVLGAGEQVVVPRFGVAQAVRHVDSGRALAWAQGRLMFDNESVSSAIEQFNRYNRVQLHVDDADLASLKLSGVFTASDPESFVAFLQSTVSVHAVREGQYDVTLRPGAGPQP